MSLDSASASMDTQAQAEPGVLGVLGGLGPLASSRFLFTLYRAYAPGIAEQRMRRVLHVSDPTFPDRTTALLAGEVDELLRRCVTHLESLCEWGASQLVVFCFTLHHLVPRFPAHLQGRLLSLPEIALDELLQRPRPALLLCTRGTHALEIFPRQARWDEASPYVVMPSTRDVEQVHEMIYEIKANGSVAAVRARIEAMAQAYGVDTVISACTEFHLVARHEPEGAAAPSAVSFIDAPLALARRLARHANDAV